MSTHLDVLADYLRMAWWESGARGPVNGEIERAQAASILADPQAHFDALVEAGVAERDHLCGEVYRIVGPEPPPHEHHWRVIGPTQADRSDTVLIGCRGCSLRHWVENELPLQIPS